MAGSEVPAALATGVCRLRHDRMEQGPTEPRAGCGASLLSSGGAGGRVLLSGLWCGADSYRDAVSLPDASGMSARHVQRSRARMLSTSALLLRFSRTESRSGAL